MKSKCSSILKSAVAIVLTVLMLLGSISSVIAATVDVAATGGGGSKTGTWYLKSDGKGSWDDGGIAKTNMGDDYNWSFYLKPTDGDLYWRYWSGSDNNNLGARTNNVDNNGGNDDAHKNGIWGSTNSWKYALTNLGSGSDYYTVTIHLDPDGGNCGNSGSTYYAGWTWVTSSKKASMSPVITTKKGSTSATSFTAGDTVSLSSSVTSGSNYGTVSYSYRYKLSTASTWTNVTGTTFTAPSTAGTYTVEVTATDGGVIKGTNARSDRTETSTKNITVTQAATTYTGISAEAMYSTDGSTFSTALSGASASVSSSSYTTGTSALTLSASDVSGYTFYKWVVTAGSGTIGTATSANTTFTPSASNTTVTARYKKNYTFSNGTTDTHGTVTVPSGTVLAGASYSGTVTPSAGYKIKTLTVGGNAVSAAVGKTSAYNYSGTTGSSATGTTTPISVVANFEPITDLQLYIAGRFRVRPSAGSSSWTTTYASGSDWNATSTNIPFTYVSGTTYKVDTYASLKELSAKPTGNQDPWFFVYDKTNSKAWHPTTQNRELGTTTEYNLTTNTDTYNVRFNSSSDDSPVTIYFDYNTKRLWYTIPDLYDVTVGTATDGTVTASPTRCEEGTSVTLTIAPTTGYQLKSITAKDSSNASVTLSGTGNTRTFTMPAKDVTVTPVFEKITWSGLTAVGKYSTTAKDDASYSNDFPAGSAPNVTIAATSATQLDGVRVTAPATDPTGYVFAGWYTTTGSFTAPNDKETTFKPNAANAVAIARYKKLHTVTISVDNTGTGAGTATVSKNSVEAGGSYTITATAASHSAVESVKVNGTAKTATASQTISPVSADQTVVVKFKSNVYLKGTMNSTAWAGDVMTANSAGTSYTIANVVLNAGTTYQFRLYADDEWKANSVTTWTLNNIATHSTSGDNLTITPSVKAKVTFVSDGTKFTSITAIPYDSTTYNVTLTQSADYTITSTYMGVEYTTSGKNANVSVPVYSGTALSYTVTPASGKYLSGVAQSNSVALSPAFSATTHANSYTGTVSSVSTAFAVSATAASKLSVAAKTNKSARGTVSINKSTAAPGESITITVSPKNGVLKTLTATYANGAVYTCDLSTKAWTKNSTSGSQSAPASTAANKFNIAVVGANIALVASGADTTYSMTLAESSAVTINATFDSYSADSNYYYYGYDDSGNAISAYNGKQMTEGMISGEKFSYYQVNGRTEENQRFKVATKASGTRRFYVETPNTTDWNGNDNMRNPYIYWFDNEWGTFEKLTYDNVHGVVDGKKWWYTTNIHEGVGCLIVNMNNTSDGGFKQTADISADDVAYGAVWISSGMSDNKYTIGGRFTENDRPGDAGTGVTYYSWGDGVYSTGSDSAAPYSFGTSGFNDHDQNYAKPKGTGYTDGSYYVLVLYPNTTYTINNITKTTGSNIDVIWLSDLPGDDENVTVYAKDGSIRSESYGSTYANIADTKIYLNNETVGTKHSGNITNQTWETYKAAKGDTLVIKTQIGATDSGTLSDAAALKAKYYVRGFCVNGEVSELLEWNANGLYTLTFKIPEDTEITKFEITPIYYLKDTTANPIVTYRVTGFTDALKEVGSGKPNWGDTLYTYPFYGKLGSQNNALGAYPGQPMVYYKGQYQMQIPQKSTAWDIYYDDGALSGYSNNTAKTNAVANTAVSGVTMSNGYYDIVHRQIMGYGSNGASADHVQTYDYGDFFKIFNEKKPVDNIVFDFKYRTKKHNFENQPAASITKSTLDTNYGTNGNGFELLTNFHGRTVDLFGTPLSGDAADPSKTTPVYVVSIGGVNGSAGVENIAGYYATEWMVYGSSNGTSYSRISAGNKNSIPPEVLVLNDDDTTSFNTTTYPSADASHNITDWKALYTALEAYRGKPVMISYEAADAQIGAGNYATSGGGGATRNDGRWLYSKNGENITSTIRIDVSHDTGATYVENPASGEVGHVDGLSAYFTNADAYQKMTYATTIDPDKTFDFEAKTTNASYKFVGWYMADGTKITSDNVSHTERSGSYTFVARFMEVSSGQLTLSHSVDTGEIVRVDGHDYTCNGSGSAKIGAVITDADTDEVLRTFDLSSSDITIPERFIGNDKNYNITVTLEATADTNTAYGTSKLANTDASSVTEDRFFNPKTPTTSGKTTTYTFTFNVKDNLYNGTTQRALALTYHSYFIQYKFNYQINYTFNDRNGETQQYKRIGTLTPGEANTYVKKVDSIRYLDKSFIEKMAPYESNFGQNITWNFEDYLISTGGEDGSNYEYNINAHYTAVQSDFNKRNITFVLPYQHINGVAVMNDGVGTKATTTNLEFIEVKNNEGEVTADNRVDFNTIPVLPNGGENGIFTEVGKKNWIAAPATIKDGSSTYNFQYWSVKPTDRAGENDPDVARCYFQGFNFVAYDNYIITPVYGESTVEPSEIRRNTNITYVETTRNQWNSNGTNYTKAQTSHAADLLYNDFIIAYNFDGKDIYNGEANAEIAELGVVVERIKKLEIKDDGSYDTTISRYSDIAPNDTGVDAAIASATDINLSGSKSISKHAIDPSSLDNKNRIQFYNGIYNSAGWVQNDEGGTPAQNYAYKNYVYRAYSYMKLKDGTVIKSAVPAYFTMYDVATADSGDM